MWFLIPVLLLGNSAFDDERWSSPVCGVDCLYWVMHEQNPDLEYGQVLNRIPLDAKAGSSMADLVRCAHELGFTGTVAVKGSIGGILKLNAPTIVRIGSGEVWHFLLASDGGGTSIKLTDPPDEERVLSEQEFAAKWDGNAIIVSKTPVDTGRSSKHIAFAGAILFLVAGVAMILQRRA